MGLLMDRDLFDVLCELNQRFNTFGGTVENTNVLERYQYMISHSEHGRNCGYARKYREMFIERDFEEVKRLVLEAAAFFNAIDNDKEGRKKSEKD